MPCPRPFQPISCRYKASKWSLRGSLLIETKCYGIDLFRESCSPYIKAIRACLLNTSEICSTGWSPLVWYKFTADLSTTAVMLLFHLKDSFLWPRTHRPHSPHACTRTDQFACTHADHPLTPDRKQSKNGPGCSHIHSTHTPSTPCRHYNSADDLQKLRTCLCFHASLVFSFHDDTKHNNSFKIHHHILHSIILTLL